MNRIVFNGRFLSQPQTGVQRYARETLLALDALLGRSDRPSLPPAILATPRGSGSLGLQHIETVELKGFSGHLWEQVTLARYCMDRRHDSLLVGFSYSGPIAVRRQVITVHDATVAAMPGAFSGKYKLMHRFLIRALRHRVEAIMTVSEFSRREIGRHYGVERDLVVGREGWEHAVATGESASSLARHGLQPGGYLLCVGSIKPNKNLQVVIDALRLTRAFKKKVAIVGVGDPKIFKQVDLPADSVMSLGFVDDACLAHLYRNADWLIFPSLYEGFGLPAIEAMANGCPVLAADASALPEVCGAGALYFDPCDPQSLADLLDRVTGEPALRDTVRTRADRALGRFTWRANAEIVADTIRRAIDPIAEAQLART